MRKITLLEIITGIILLTIIIFLIIENVKRTNENTNKSITSLTELQNKLQNINQELSQIRQQIEKANEHFSKTNHQKVTITAYHPPSKGINSDKTPNRTATMKRPIAGYTLAISDELFEMGWLGKRIYIDGWGVGKATDRMKSTVQGKRIDICAPTLKAAKKIGIRANILAVVLN